MKALNDLAKALRFLSVDAVEKAQSGHPGMPLGMADIATVLWKKYLKHNPNNPRWFNRDRFVISNGHGSMLLYALLHMSGYALTLEDLKQFRQLGSKTPGHPEHEITAGVETTTGPLAQGLANAVGMALAEKGLAAQFNRPNFPLVDHYTYVFVGDGCLMEGLSHEACSLAGTLGLGKLIVFYDSNGISIDGKVQNWFSDDSAARFKAYHWQVIDAVDGHDTQAIEAAIEQARAETRYPSLIICKTTIGLGSPLAGSEKSHGAPLGAAARDQLCDYFSWDYPAFVVPEELYAAWDQRKEGQIVEDAWLRLCHAYQEEDRTGYHEFLRRINGDLPDDWPLKTQAFIESCLSEQKAMATRKSSQHCLEFYSLLLPELLGGSADLTHSNNTQVSRSKPILREDLSGNYLYYGVREFAMAALMNGIALHGGYIPYGGTFLVFADYARNAIRLSALMKQRVIYVLSHDSIGLGEDGPTHQPIEHAAMLRLTPDLAVWRPADLFETAIAWQVALENHQGPSCLLLSRQDLPALPHHVSQSEEIKKGAYIVQEAKTEPKLLLLATGSEVHLALAAVKALGDAAAGIQVVSLPCCERFLAQAPAYQEKVLPAQIRKRIAIEAAASHYWYRFVGLDGKVLGLDHFGLSGPGSKLYEHFHLSVEKLIQTIKDMLAQAL